MPEGRVVKTGACLFFLYMNLWFVELSDPVHPGGAAAYRGPRGHPRGHLLLSPGALGLLRYPQKSSYYDKKEDVIGPFFRSFHLGTLFNL
jgi:hypothetical protein